MQHSGPIIAVIKWVSISNILFDTDFYESSTEVLMPIRIPYKLTYFWEVLVLLLLQYLLNSFAYEQFCICLFRSKLYCVLWDLVTSTYAQD